MCLCAGFLIFFLQEYFNSRSVGCATWGIKCICLQKKSVLRKPFPSFIEEVAKHARNKVSYKVMISRLR